jgi:hypothetical protein
MADCASLQSAYEAQSGLRVVTVILGVQPVPWRPALEQHLDRPVSGVMMLDDGRINWSFGLETAFGR